MSVFGINILNNHEEHLIRSLPRSQVRAESGCVRYVFARYIGKKESRAIALH